MGELQSHLLKQLPRQLWTSEEKCSKHQGQEPEHSGTSGISGLLRDRTKDIASFYPRTRVGTVSRGPVAQTASPASSPCPSSAPEGLQEERQAMFSLSYQTPHSSCLNRNTTCRRPALTAKSFLAVIDAGIVTSSGHLLWTEDAEKAPKMLQAYIL